MSWEWSHTQEAYTAVEDQIEKKDREWLIVVYAEWVAYTGSSSCTSMDSDKYDAALEEAKGLTNEILAGHIWRRASEQRTCTNGGWEAWACPYGCGPHLVPFTPGVQRPKD